MKKKKRRHQPLLIAISVKVAASISNNSEKKLKEPILKLLTFSAESPKSRNVRKHSSHNFTEPGIKKYLRPQ
jgi:hypothetical protein